MKATKTQNFFTALKVGLRSMARYPKMTAVFIAATLAQGFFQGLLVWALQKALTMFSNSQDLTILTLVGAAVLILFISLFQSAGTFVAEVMSVRVANRIEIDWMWLVLAKILSLPVRYFERNSQGNLVMSSYQDMAGVRSVTEEVGRLILYVTRLAALGFAAFLISPKLALIGFVAIPLVALPANWFGHRITRAAEKRRFGLAIWHDTFLQVSSGIRVVKVNRGEKRVLDKAKELSEELYWYIVSQAQNRGLARFILEAVSAVGLIIVLIVGGQDVAAGTLNWQSLMSLLIAVLAVYSPIVSLLQTYTTIRAVIPNLERVEQLLAIKPAIEDRPNPKPLKGAPSVIELKNVSFAYDDQIILKSISATFHKGETIGIVGPSGTGKSTLISLMLRFYDTTAGHVLFDGVDLRDLRQADLMDNCALVMQEPILFVDTIANNIRLTRPNATMDEVIAAAKAANIHDEIMAMTDGYDSMLGLGEDSRGLSVGQKQRVCIAAALLKNAPILFLDEATSNLDAVSERKVQEALDRLAEGRTTFIVAHRMSALHKADRILVLDRGRIVGFAPHEELLQTCEVYHRLWSYQVLDRMPQTKQAQDAQAAIQR